MKRLLRPPDLTWLLRTAWALAGLLWFLWLAYEDRSTAPVLLISTAISAALAITAMARWTRESSFEGRGWVLRAAAAGLLGGVLIGPLGALLMLLKASLHVHPIPDFTAEQLLSVIRGGPLWAVVGLTIGIGAGILGLYRLTDQK